MSPIRLNRRRFLGCSAAAGLALSQGVGVEGAGSSRAVRLGFIGLGNRGTALLRTAAEVPGVEIAAVCDTEPKHALRAMGIVEKAKGTRPDGLEHFGQLLERTDVDAVIAALPCDEHAEVYCQALRARKHLYAEKPLALTPAQCDLVIAESAKAPELAAHVGFQRRSNPRYRAGVDVARRGDLGALVEGRADWISSNGPVNGHGGWLARRERSGDWMVEQAVHVWDLFRWITGELPTRAYGHGRRDVFAHLQPDRDVTDHYSVLLEWPNGFHASLIHSWVDPADDAFTGVSQKVVGTSGGLDFKSGIVTYREKGRARLSLHPGNIPDTRFALEAFVDAIRSEEPSDPPISLLEAKDATLVGLLVRRAIDERRAVTMDELLGLA
jgi:predicted dehydrogenase